MGPPQVPKPAWQSKGSFVANEAKLVWEEIKTTEDTSVYFATKILFIAGVEINNNVISQLFANLRSPRKDA